MTSAPTPSKRQADDRGPSMRQHEPVRNPALGVIEGGLRRQALPPRLRQPLILIALASAIVTVALGVIVAGTSSATLVDYRMLEFANGISGSIGAALFIDAA